MTPFLFYPSQKPLDFPLNLMYNVSIVNQPRKELYMSWTTETNPKPLQTMKESLGILPKINTNEKLVDEVKGGMTVRIGGKLVKFQVTEEITLPEDEIRAELQVVMDHRIADIQKDYDNKVVEMSYMSDIARKDFEAKEKLLNEKLKVVKPMPEISFDHAKAGLSVVRGGNAGEYYWLYQTVYWPKFVNERPIAVSYIKKMITPMTIVIFTKDDKVISVTTRKSIGLEKFDHYHNTGSGDCWGVWKWMSTWNTPNDIITVCKDATAVLENINGSSLARRTPSGLPSYTSVLKNSTPPSSVPVETKLSKNDERIGVVEVNNRDEITGGSWTT